MHGGEEKNFFVKYFCHSDFQNRVVDKKKNIQLLLQFVMKYITLFLIVTQLFFFIQKRLTQL